MRRLGRRLVLVTLLGVSSACFPFHHEAEDGGYASTGLNVADLQRVYLDVSLAYGPVVVGSSPGSGAHLQINISFNTATGGCTLRPEAVATANGVVLPVFGSGLNIGEAGGVYGCTGQWTTSTGSITVDDVLTRILDAHVDGVDDEFVLSDSTGSIRVAGPFLFARRDFVVTSLDAGVLHLAEQAQIELNHPSEKIDLDGLAILYLDGAATRMQTSSNVIEGSLPFVVPADAALGEGYLVLNIAESPMLVSRCIGAMSCTARLDSVGGLSPIHLQVAP